MSDLFKIITQKWAFLSTRRIFIACSGGVDSMTLLYILKKAKWNIEVLHVNYQLRGEDSELDMNLVKETCERLSIPFHLKRIDLQPLLDSSGGNLQEMARNIRYAFFEEKRIKSPNNYIALGHHKDDQIETFFMHLARKSGIMGMSCMPSEYNQFIRPLLDFSKAEIIQYAIENKIKWREDYTNKKNKYTRNILRNILLPKVESQIPTLNESVLLLIKKFQETQLELEFIIKPISEKFIKNKILNFNIFDSLYENQKVELLRQLGQKASLVNELNKLRSTQKGKKILFESTINSFECIIRDEDNFQLIEKDSNLTSVPTLFIEEVSDLPAVFSKNEIYLDPSKLIGELNLRKWKEGDRMTPLGMKGSKLISDIIKDAKIPSIDKKNILILEDENHILWCIGIRLGAFGIANDLSKKKLKISLK
jgi:tRNA(Ile)-lysidine synthase